jgi:putative DNA-invertase from lambdoid prophage Rac
MIAALYARVSTEDQHCEMQLAELRAYCQRMGWTATEYVEKASTRKKRPELERLLGDARQRKLDVLLVWKLDRFGRSVRELHDNIAHLDQSGVRFLALMSNIDTDQRNPTSRLLLNMLAAFAEFERDLIQERTKAGIAQARRQGKHCGRPALVFDRAKAATLRKQGRTWPEISKALSVPITTIRRALHSA